MSVLIADSGSTKCDWVLLCRESNDTQSWSTQGFNPYFHDTEVIKTKVEEAHQGNKSEVEEVYYYGSGCSSPRLNKIVELALQAVYPNADVHVDHDVLGASYATYTGEPAITCILGTGSNSSFFDGSEVSEEVPSLAYVLGDESSGNYYGKQLLRAYFYKKLTPELREAFEEKYGVMDKNDFIYRVYNEPHANVYLATFMKFLGEHPQHPQVLGWVREGMKEFIDIHVLCFPQAKEVPVHFIGSVAYYFRHVLEPTMETLGLRMGTIIKKPIDGLVNYHKQYIFSQP